MCGLIASVGRNNILPMLIRGLTHLEYRGYDSAGIAILEPGETFRVHRTAGPVSRLAEAVSRQGWATHLGIAHTRWATHGKPSESNAHPHLSEDAVAIVHNGIIENHAQLRERLRKQGYRFRSDTDSEVIAHCIAEHLRGSAALEDAVLRATAGFEGSYAIAVIARNYPREIVAARRGNPLLIGLGQAETFVASDLSALAPFTDRFITLDEGDVARLTADRVMFWDSNGNEVSRLPQRFSFNDTTTEKGDFEHFMLKEIFAQPQAIANGLDGRMARGALQTNLLHPAESDLLGRVRHLHIVGCGSSYHAGLAARYAIESITGCSCSVELASEYRYHRRVVPKDCLFLTLSQSGETADTLAALRAARQAQYLSTLTICNVPHSSMVRESDHALAMRAGPEIGVASTKAFTSQLLCLLLLAIGIADTQARFREQAALLAKEIENLPDLIIKALAEEHRIREAAAALSDSPHTIFLGRGPLYPIAMEGALKLKEISYIPSEGYAGGELKHGPLALVDKHTPVIALLPNNRLRGKMISNLQEVQARQGQLLVIGEDISWADEGDGVGFLRVPTCGELISPVVYSVPLQLLAYHAAVLRGNDVDKPRNLAKAVTVE